MLSAVLAGLVVGALLSGRNGSSAPIPSYSNAVVADDPVGYWPLDEPLGARRAQPLVGDLRGTYVRTGITGGVANRGRTFDGRDSFVAIPDSPLWSQPTAGALTVEFWMRPSVLTFPVEEGSGYVWILGKGTPGNQEWGFRMYGKDNTENPPRENRISFYAYSPEGGQGAGAYFQDQIKPGKWIYVVGELTAEGVAIYKNAVFRQGPPAKATMYADPAYNVKPTDGNAPLRIGTRNLHSFFEGAIDEVAIYPYLLSQAQIRRHYRAALRANPRLATG